MINYYKTEKENYIESLKLRGLPIPKRTMHDNIIKNLQGFVKVLTCSECNEPSTLEENGKFYCADCHDELFSYCNKNNKYYELDLVETCCICEETFHVDHMATKDNRGNYICNDCIEEYNRQENDTNFPEKDSFNG